jgi:hypothetical protein
MKVTLNKPHTHAGVDHPAGAVINVTHTDAEWLIAADVISPPNASPRGDTDTTTGAHDHAES